MTTLDNIHSNELALFQEPVIDTSDLGREWVTYRPINPFFDGAAIEFNIPALSTQYLDLKRMKLRVKINITRGDGTPMESTLDSSKDGHKPDIVGIVNAPLHSLFSQVDISLQQRSLSQLGPNYPYKAYLDLLLGTEDEQELYSQTFVKDDDFIKWGDLATMGTSTGVVERTKALLDGKTTDLISGLKLDICQQDRLILNGVPVNLKFWPTKHEFRLLTDDIDKQFKLNIVDISLEVAVANISPGVLLGHADALKDTPALYPYTRSVIKTYSITPRQYSFTTDDMFQGQVPNQLILGLVPSVAVYGSYLWNPFYFHPFDCNYIGFYVNGQSVPNHPLQPNYKSEHFVEAFSTIKNSAVNISRLDYTRGYCLYVINPNGIYHPDRINPRGHTRLELKFAQPLDYSVTLIAYAKFPALVKIDQSRNVILE
jgi:hypothetical protein